MHILLSPRIVYEERFYALEVAEINESLCTRCKLCEQHCRFQASAHCQVDPGKCEGCGVCSFVCPETAISTYPKSVGKIINSETRYGEFIHGRLEPGSTNSGKMVTRIRELAYKKAEEKQTDLILIDGSPGIGCPVIASITGVDMVLVVAEPTLSGIHDLKRVIGLTEQLRVRCSVIINKFDINESNCGTIEDICSQHDLPLLGKIPFSTLFTDSMVAGLPLVEYADGNISVVVGNIWEKVRKAADVRRQANTPTNTIIQGVKG